MNPQLKAAGASSIAATIQHVDGGGFVAIASDGNLDRDGERVQPGALSWETPTVPIHVGHTMNPQDVVARGRPYYDLDNLMVDATFGSHKDAQEVRQKVADGTLDSLSIVFLGKQWETIDGVRTCVRGDLLAADLVSIPSNSRARILSVRSMAPGSYGAQARALCWEVERDLARLEIAQAKALLARTRPTARDTVDRFLRSL